MAVNYWQGTSASWNTAGNWTDGVPNAGDEIIFDGRVSQSCTTGMMSGNIAFDLLHIKNSFSGDVGSAAAPITLGLASSDNLYVIHSGS